MSDSALSPSQPAPAPAGVAWCDPRREAAFHAWLARVAPAHELQAATVRPASADASFRRYLRVDGNDGSYIIMDAPPERENCAPFVKVAGHAGVPENERCDELARRAITTRGSAGRI